MVNIFNPKKSEAPPPTPKWLRWGILIFALLVGINAYRAEVGDSPDAPRLEHYPEVKDFVSANRWQRIINPHYDRDEAASSEAEEDLSFWPEDEEFEDNFEAFDDFENWFYTPEPAALPAQPAASSETDLR